MLSTIWDIFLLSVTIFAVAQLMPGIELKGFGTAILVAIVYSLISFVLFKVLVFLSLPAVLVTFGLFIFVINAFLLWITDKILDDFQIKSFGTTIIAAVLITVLNGILQWLF